MYIIMPHYYNSLDIISIVQGHLFSNMAQLLMHMARGDIALHMYMKSYSQR